MKLRGTATNNLADVIQMLQMDRKTGTLTLQRKGKGDTAEQGTMMFQDGQIVDAGLGLIWGNAAFEKLMIWRACHFVFQASSPANVPTSHPSLPERSSVRKGSSPTHGMTNRRETSPTSAVPHRLRDPQEVLAHFDRLGLTRGHRQLFLLINGQYTISELMRISGQRADNFERLLTDLERVGLVLR